MSEKDQFFSCELTLTNKTIKRGKTSLVIHDEKNRVASIKFEFNETECNCGIYQVISVSLFLNANVQIATIYLMGKTVTRENYIYTYKDEKGGLACQFSCTPNHMIKTVDIRVDYVRFILLLKSLQNKPINEKH